MTEKQRNLFELQLKLVCELLDSIFQVVVYSFICFMFDTLQNKARKANQQAMVPEKKMMESRGESRCVPKQKWLEDRKKIGNLLDSNGLHSYCNKHTCLTQQTTKAKYKKWEKEPVAHGSGD
jgi:pre-mRNA-splicing factor SYF2